MPSSSHLPQVFWSDSLARVLDYDPGRAILLPGRPHPYAPAGRCELDGIMRQVEENLVKLVAVGDHDEFVPRSLAGQVDSLRGGRPLQLVDHHFDDLGQADRRGVE